MKIIVVEDEIRIREGISRLLHKLDPDYELAGEAENGREGLALIRQKRPELVITDIRMPVMDGLEMLRALHEENIPVKAVVLSAYSEFEYARQAIKLGVTEYLLKPVGVSELSVALEHVKERLLEERMRQPEQMGTLEQVLGGVLTGGIVADEELLDYAEQKYGIPGDKKLGMLVLYMGGKAGENAEALKRRMRDMLLSVQGVRGAELELPQRKSILYLFYDYRELSTLERWLQRRLLTIGERRSAAVGWVCTNGLTGLKEAFDLLYPYMDWNIALGDGVMISYPKITRVQTSPCIYPAELEKRMKTAVCASDPEKLTELTDKFHDFFRDGRVYAPKEMKECYVRFLWALIDTGKEIGRLDYESLEQQKLLEAVMSARTGEELKEAVDFLLGRLKWEPQESPEVSHLTVKRAVVMIREFYGSGITLDEIAARLNITPEYLGTQFHKELGVNFSAYIKNYRMQKAKELLIGTQLKLYEIAEKVGYSDPKYFGRVFKESTGQQPLDYRKTHK